MVNMINANNPKLKSWVEVPNNSDFPIQNLPFGIFSTEKKNKRVGVAIGEKIIDLASLKELGYLNELPFSAEDFHNSYLNAMMQHGKFAVRALRNQVSFLLDQKNDELQSNKNHCDLVLDNQ